MAEVSGDTHNSKHKNYALAQCTITALRQPTSPARCDRLVIIYGECKFKLT